MLPEGSARSPSGYAVKSGGEVEVHCVCLAGDDSPNDRRRVCDSLSVAPVVVQPFIRG